MCGTWRAARPGLHATSTALAWPVHRPPIVWAPAHGDAERQGTSGMELIDAAHPRYDQYRALFNGMIDRRPGLIAR